jgi:hypothetical protein
MMFFVLTNCHRTLWSFGFDRRVLCVGIMSQGIIFIWLYHLTGDELRQRCQERKLVARGPIRLLRERFCTYVKCSPVEATCYVNMVQASAKTDKAASNNVDPVLLTLDPCSLGAVWTVRLRCWWNCYAIDSLSSEEPADILQLFYVRRDYNLRLEADCIFFIYVSPLVTGNVLTHLGDCIN